MALATLLWNERALVLRPEDEHTAGALGEGGYAASPGVGGGDTPIPWEQVTRIEAIHPWPTLWVRWEPDGAGFAREQVHHPRGRPPLLPRSPLAIDAMEGFGRLVEELFDWLREAHTRPEGVIVPGWTGLPDVPWEPVPGLPEDAPSTGGAYRSGGRSRRVVGQRVVARRPRPGIIELLLAWLAPSDRRPWNETLREVVLTDDHVYARLWDRTCWRLPLSALSVRLGDTGSDAIYVFGRRTFLVLTARRGDEVTRRLDRLLATRDG